MATEGTEHVLNFNAYFIVLICVACVHHSFSNVMEYIERFKIY